VVSGAVKAQRRRGPFLPSTAAASRLGIWRGTTFVGVADVYPAVRDEEEAGPAQMRPLPGSRTWPPVCKWPTPSALARVAVCGDAGSLEAAAAQCFET
jgi:hypothetical protein